MFVFCWINTEYGSNNEVNIGAEKKQHIKSRASETRRIVRLNKNAIFCIQTWLLYANYKQIIGKIS